MVKTTRADLRANLDAWLDRVVTERLELVVRRRGKEDVVILPLREWTGTLETLHIMSSPANYSRLRESIAELDAGLGKEHDLIEPKDIS